MCSSCNTNVNTFITLSFALKRLTDHVCPDSDSESKVRTLECLKDENLYLQNEVALPVIIELPNTSSSTYSLFGNRILEINNLKLQLEAHHACRCSFGPL